MSLAPDEGSVQQPATASPNPAFGDRVHTGRPELQSTVRMQRRRGQRRTRR
jgi:hypothetical protein